MNRRQAKKKLKAEYGFITPRQASPRVTKKYMLKLLDIYTDRIVKYINNLIINGKSEE